MPVVRAARIDPGVEASLMPMMERSAAFFDLDKTIIAKGAVPALRQPFHQGGLISRTAVVRLLYAQVVFLLLGADERKLARMRDALLTLTKGWEQEHVRKVVEEAIAEVIDPIIYAEALELIRTHRAAGRRVFIVSASPEEVVEPLARHLGASDVIASQARIDEDGRYTGELARYAYGPAKAAAISEIATRDGIDLETSFAYSDSHTDIPMLELVGHPVAVNPDHGLSKEAKARGWEIQRFSKPVALREARRALPLTGVAMLAGAVVAALIVLAARQRSIRNPSKAPGSLGPQAGRSAARSSRARQQRPQPAAWRRLATRTPSPTSTARIKSFFMGM